MEKEIKIAVLENQFEAQLLSSILIERDIPHHIRSYHDTAYDGLFQATRGWGALYGPESLKDTITGILEEIRQNHKKTDMEPDPDTEI